MDKQKIRDRIDELEFKRKDYVQIIKGHSPVLIGLTALGISFILYQLDKGNLLMAIINFGILIVTIVFLSMLSSYSSSKNKKIKEKIQKNYDLLLDREQ